MNEATLLRAYGLDPASWEATTEPAYEPEAAIGVADEPDPDAPEPPID